MDKFKLSKRLAITSAAIKSSHLRHKTPNKT